MGHDLVGLGEVMLRLAAPPPLRLDQALSLDVQIGGSEANVLAAVSRLGLRTGLITALPAEHARSEEHTSELQSRPQLVCRLLLAKKRMCCEMHVTREHSRLR